jgi:hypothetical protein
MRAREERVSSWRGYRVRAKEKVLVYDDMQPSDLPIWKRKG